MKAKPSPIIMRSSDTEQMKFALGNVQSVPVTSLPVKLSSTSSISAQGISQAEVGRTVIWPVAKVKEHALNSRVFYATEEIDEISQSLTNNGQSVPAIGYPDGDFVVLLDGQKRLRGCKAAGIENLRIELCEKPATVAQLYLNSRRINKERSSQTLLDDAVRFEYLIEAKVFPSQEALAAELKISQSMVSKIKKLNVIPERLMRRLRDTGIANNIDALSSITTLFKYPDAEQAADIATEVVDEVIRRNLTGVQTTALVNSRLTGPRKRDRYEVRHFAFGTAKAVLKSNDEKGRIDFSLKDLAPGQVDLLKLKIEALCASMGSATPETSTQS